MRCLAVRMDQIGFFTAAIIMVFPFGPVFAAAGAETPPPKTTKATAAHAPVRADVEAQLRANAALGEKEIRRWGPGADMVLIAIAQDPKVDFNLRSRAVSALAYAPSVATARYLTSIIDGKAAKRPPTEDTPLRRRAAIALGWIGGPMAPATLAPLLANADPDVRIDAALALGLTRLGKAADVLRARLTEEKDERVRSNIGRQLRVIEATLPAGATAPPPEPPGNHATPPADRIRGFSGE